MSATATLIPLDDDTPDVSVPVPPLSPRLQVVRAALIVVCVLSAGLVLQLTLVSRLQHHAAQVSSFDSFRNQLANGVAPIGPADEQLHALPLGAGVAYLEIPAIGVHEMVGEGTTSGVLFDGPGHRRDTVLPGQAGTSVIFGRRAAFGGPFRRLPELTSGQAITVTTGQGVFKFRVLDVRREGDPVPPPSASGSSRIILVTAAGSAFLPNGLIRVDADLDGQAVGGPARAIATAAMPAEEAALAGDARTFWALALWLQGLIALAIGAVWSFHRWGRSQTWVVFVPLLTLAGLAAAGEVARLLPNLL
jgi:LPXTG-site transpeptidase (sortase) family protein